MAAPLPIPQDVRKFVKNVFSLCNIEATKNLSNNPNAPEQYLDLSVINVLASHSSPVRLASGWLVRIETHYLGSLRHYRNWEIADIGLLLSVRQPNQPRIAKVGLLQSKRLYPKKLTNCFPSILRWALAVYSTRRMINLFMPAWGRQVSILPTTVVTVL